MMRICIGYSIGAMMRMPTVAAEHMQRRAQRHQCSTIYRSSFHNRYHVHVQMSVMGRTSGMARGERKAEEANQEQQ